jgi:hypothetical protein
MGRRPKRRRESVRGRIESPVRCSTHRPVRSLDGWRIRFHESNSSGRYFQKKLGSSSCAPSPHASTDVHNDPSEVALIGGPE